MLNASFRAIAITLLPRNEFSLCNLETWLKVHRGTFIRAEYTTKNIRLIWQPK